MRPYKTQFTTPIYAFLLLYSLTFGVAFGADLANTSKPGNQTLPTIQGKDTATDSQVNRIPGFIMARNIKGTVWRTRPNSSQKELVKDQTKIRQEDVIETDVASSVVLIFSNGSAISVAENTRFAIDKYLQEPFKYTEGMAQLQKEPSSSETAITVDYGSIIGKVNKLNTAKNSSYKINTPAGSGGIRGTNYQTIVNTSNPNNPTTTFKITQGSGTYQPVGSNVAAPIGSNQAISSDINSNIARPPVTNAAEINAIADGLSQTINNNDLSVTFANNGGVDPDDEATEPPSQGELPNVIIDLDPNGEEFTEPGTQGDVPNIIVDLNQDTPPPA
jgi:hypothetical protein